MILISLCYGRQTAVPEGRGKEDSASADGFAGSAFSDEVLLNDVEQLGHLLPYDMGLSEKDCAWHFSFVGLRSIEGSQKYAHQDAEIRRPEKRALDFEK